MARIGQVRAHSPPNVPLHQTDRRQSGEDPQVRVQELQVADEKETSPALLEHQEDVEGQSGPQVRPLHEQKEEKGVQAEGEEAQSPVLEAGAGGVGEGEGAVVEKQAREVAGLAARGLAGQG